MHRCVKPSIAYAVKPDTIRRLSAHRQNCIDFGTNRTNVRLVRNVQSKLLFDIGEVTMWVDPIVAETRAVRDRIAVQFQYDVWKLGEHFKAKGQIEARQMIAQAMCAVSVPTPFPHAQSAATSESTKRKQLAEAATTA